MYDYLLDAIGAFWRYGASPTALVVALIAFFKTKHFKRFVGRRAPWLFKDDSDVLNYQSRQIRIESKLDALMSAGGIQWDAHYLNGRPKQNETGGRKNSLLRQLAAFVRAPITGVSIRMTEDSYHFKIREGNIQMKKWLRADSLTVLGGILTAAIARYFDVTINPENIIAGAIMLISYFKAHEYVTIIRDANGLYTGFKINSRKFIFTGVAFALVVADVAFNLNMGNELIFAITLGITGYNFAEGKKDAKQAEHTGESNSSGNHYR